MGEAALDVLVTCHPYSDQPTKFPQVRGFYLAKHLARSGLRAEFRQLPAPSVECEVLICSDYQGDMEWFEGRLAEPLTEIRAQRLYCLIDESLARHRDHFSRPVCDWFAARGGVLCHLADGLLLRHERWVGLGIDGEVVTPAADGRRDTVLFDFPKSTQLDTSLRFDVGVLDVVREMLPTVRVVGSGPAEATIRDAFDDWIAYDQDHATYVAAALDGLIAIVPGTSESLGVTLAEAQVAGACVVASEFQVNRFMRVPEAKVGYTAGDPRSLAHALAVASVRSGERIREQALERFDFEAVVERTRAAVHL